MKTTDLAYLHQLDQPDEEGAYTRSLLDLIEEGTLDLDLAAFLVSHIARGASFITGSGPGGVGKTTTKRALLSFVPPGLSFFNALPGQVDPVDSGPTCAIADELSGGRPPTYLWGDDLRAFFQLGQRGHLLTSTIHADDLDETHAQIVEENGVPVEQFRHVDLLIHICLEGGNPPERRIHDKTTRRIVNKVYYSDGTIPHALVYEAGGARSSAAVLDAAFEAACRSFLEEALAGQERRLATVRERFLTWLAS